MTTKLPVAQQDGEISFTPGGIKPPRTYQVTKGAIDVADEDLAEVSVGLSSGLGTLNPDQLEAAKKNAEQAAHDQVITAAAAAANAKEVAAATAAGAARAAAELADPKPPKNASASGS